MYEERPEKKRRAPAWCDRVLWRAREAGHINCVRYSAADLVLSDHKPVCAELSTKVTLSTYVLHIRRNGLNHIAGACTGGKEPINPP